MTLSAPSPEYTWQLLDDQGSEETSRARRDGIIGCDFHTRYQQIAMMDEATGESTERRLDHQSGEADAFYRHLQAPVAHPSRPPRRTKGRRFCSSSEPNRCRAVRCVHLPAEGGFRVPLRNALPLAPFHPRKPSVVDSTRPTSPPASTVEGLPARLREEAHDPSSRVNYTGVYPEQSRRDGD